MKNLPPARVRWMRIRIAMLAGLLMLGALAVLHRAYQLQLKQGPELRAMAEKQYLRDVHLAPKRGTIYDRHGAELAVSVDVESVWANPRVLKRAGTDVAQTAATLASMLDVDVQTLLGRLSSDRYFVWLKRRVTPKQAQAVRDLNIDGVSLSREARRYYPNRELAAHVLGFSNVDGVGIEGLELALEDRLRGPNEAVTAIADRRGKVVFSETLLDGRSMQGQDVHLTIDRTIQRLAEHEIELAVRTFEAHAGSVVVMDPATGELLAIANFPTFNPNDPGSSSVTDRRNRAVTDRFEPGSTIKPFTVAGALAAGTVRPDQEIDCENGIMQVADKKIRDTHHWEKLTPGRILAYSSNIGTAKIGFDLGRAGLYQVLRGFGFGQPTGIELPGETGGILRHYKQWYEMDAATIAFGQGLSTTTLQLAMGFGALANQGRLMRPILVKRFTDARGDVSEENPAVVRRQVVPRQVARLVSDMLTGVTAEDGTGAEASLADYLVAGKTGTAQKADYVHGGYAEGRWTSSFVGFVPADRPRLVIAVVVDEPLITHNGGMVAAPVFRRVAEGALRQLGVSAPGAPVYAWADARKAQAAATETANANDRAAATAASSADAVVSVTEDQARVPDMIGMTARRAFVSAARAGLTLNVRGSGVVATQLPAAGEVVGKGTAVVATLMAPASSNPQGTFSQGDADQAQAAAAGPLAQTEVEVTP